MGIGIRRIKMGIKTWEWEKSLHTVTVASACNVACVSVVA